MNWLARILGFALVASIATRAMAFGTPLCPGPFRIEGPVFISFDAPYTIYTINMTTRPDGTYAFTRVDITAADLASLCGEGFDVEAVADSTAQGSYFPTVVEFYNAALDHYFLTADVQEISDLDNGVHPGWKRTGQQFQVYVQDPTPVSGQAPLADVCRYYGLPAFGLDTHFYSGISDECDAVAKNWPDRWELETPDAFAVHLPDSSDGTCPPGTSPLYRLFNNRADVNHRYTTWLAIRNQMIAQSWIPEGYGKLGVSMCVRPM